MKELIHTYEASVQRKDQVISNLTQALSKQREKQEALRTFSDWKIQHIDLKREVSLNTEKQGARRTLSDWKIQHIDLKREVSLNRGINRRPSGPYLTGRYST
jgi:hypothetical protein